MGTNAISPQLAGHSSLSGVTIAVGCLSRTKADELVMSEHVHLEQFRHYATGAEGRVEIESEWTARNANERRGNFVRLSNCPTQAKGGLEWATCPLHLGRHLFKPLEAKV